MHKTSAELLKVGRQHSAKGGKILFVHRTNDTATFVCVCVLASPCELYFLGYFI